MNNCETPINIQEEGGEQGINLQPEGAEQGVKTTPECLRVTPIEDRDYNRLYNKPQINGVELVGNKTSEDLGIEGDKNYVHMQTTASDTWVITHNLDKLPSVTVIDSAEEEVVGEIIYDNNNQITIKFTAAFKGKAVLN